MNGGILITSRCQVGELKPPQKNNVASSPLAANERGRMDEAPFDNIIERNVSLLDCSLGKSGEGCSSRLSGVDDNWNTFFPKHLGD